jgi:hypothetical protein
MTEVLVEFSRAVAGPSGAMYLPRACGKEREDGLWEGWIEFVPVGEGEVLRSPRETEQPNRADLAYWATGLTPVYFEGALQRALRPSRPTGATGTAVPQFARPKPGSRQPVAPPATKPVSHPVLDPFHVYAQGEGILRQELSALHAQRLREIIQAHGLADPATVDLDSMSREALTELLFAAVKARAKQSPPA